MLSKAGARAGEERGFVSQGMREKVALWAGKVLGGIPRARKKLVSSCLPAGYP